MTDPCASIECPCAECGNEARPGSNYCCEGCEAEGWYQRGYKRGYEQGYLAGRNDEMVSAHAGERR